MTTFEIEEVILKSMMDRNFKVFCTGIEVACMFESDVFGVNTSGYMYEYEIKQSRSDFKADFKKKKHLHMTNRDASRKYNKYVKGNRTKEKQECIKIPNRFYFVCNHSMIKVDEVPEYAGLIYMRDGVMLEVKPAKQLHKIKANEQVYKTIATKLSYRIACGSKFIRDKYCKRP